MKCHIYEVYLELQATHDSTKSLENSQQKDVSIARALNINSWAPLDRCDEKLHHQDKTL